MSRHVAVVIWSNLFARRLVDGVASAAAHSFVTGRGSRLQLWDLVCDDDSRHLVPDRDRRRRRGVFAIAIVG
ncbi:hypothetical protein L484_022238 [Morus notabilis]|uniref:Uncharacterized protein n=1 Tax=Morus notabilis TaxID=981085 RepID=W9SUP7_9ROSA|nr:hypothetical protein L484_022238 [Morus notabilis]